MFPRKCSVSLSDFFFLAHSFLSNFIWLIRSLSTYYLFILLFFCFLLLNGQWCIVQMSFVHGLNKYLVAIRNDNKWKAYTLSLSLYVAHCRCLACNNFFSRNLSFSICQPFFSQKKKFSLFLDFWYFLLRFCLVASSEFIIMFAFKCRFWH